jgi:hypothetical protein
MSSCSAFLPRDPEQAEQVIRNLLRVALAGQFQVATGHGRRDLCLEEIVRRTTQQVERLKQTGVLPTDDPDDVVFEELCVSEPEGSTVDVVAHVVPDTALILRVHHGRGNAVTFHLPSVRASYARLHDPKTVVGIAHDALINSLVLAFRTRHRAAMPSLMEALRRTCADAGALELVPQDEDAAVTEGRRILDALARQRAASTGT